MIGKGLRFMPVRGTTAHSHAIIQKKAINMDHAANGGTVKFVMCAWDDCERDGYEMYKIVVETGNVKDGHPSRPLTYIHCSERHRQYQMQSMRQAEAAKHGEFLAHGDLPPGYKGGR
jgi:hypothetical protein